MKKMVSMLLVLLMPMSIIAGCTAADGYSQGKYVPGTYSGESKGFGGAVKVTLEVDADKILNVTAEGAEETNGVGSKAIDQLPGAILEAQNTDIDVIGGATVSSKALLRAAQGAIAQALVEQEQDIELSMKPGTYTAKAKGFGGNVIATVKVSDKAIENIQLENEPIDNPLIDTEDPLSLYTASMNMETPQIFLGVKELLPERIIAAQSVAVDAITGATASSNAALQAIGSALEQAGADSRAINKTVAKQVRDTEKYEADIVVVGGGTSGSAAAAQAAELGAKVILVEKSARIGGSGALSTGPLSINSKFQTALGQQGDQQAVFEKFEELVHWSNKAGVFSKFLQKSGSTADWLAANGFEWAENSLMSIPKQYGVTGVGYKEDSVSSMGVYNSFQKLVSKVDTILTETTATSIITDEQGNAVGITAEKYDGTKVEIRAKAVIMATGGYGGNKELLKEKTGYPYALFGLKQNVGEGFNMMKAVGAAEKNASMISTHLVGVSGTITGFDAFDTNIPYALMITPSLMQVNTRGERFASETVSQDEMLMGSVYHAAQGDLYYTLISKAQTDKLAKDGSKAIGMDSKPGTFSFRGQAVKPDVAMPNIENVLNAAVEQGLAYKGNTLEELAVNAGMDIKTLKANVERYNQLSEQGKDLDFYKDSKYMSSLGNEGPYYAIKGQPEIYGTLGCVDVDANGQVLRPDGSVIGGLYAAGVESIGVVFDGVAYTQVEGVALGWGFNSGRITAESAVQAIQE